MSTFTVATFNTLHGTAEIHPLASVIGWQEADTTAGRKKIRNLDGYATYIPKADALSAIPISWRTDTWELVAAGEQMTHAGKAGVTPNRGYSWVNLRHRATGVVVCFVNTHFISGAWSWRMTPWRRDRWNEHMRELAAFVTKRGQTMPVVLVGDMNRPEWLRLPGFHHAAIRSGRVPIDQIHSTLPLSGVRRGPKHGSDHYSWTATATLKEAPMSTGIYLEDNPPARSQFRVGRRAKPTGLIVVHTAEGIMDTVGPDTGAEAVASFIQRRDTPGSYHRLADSDSVVKLVRFSNEAYGDGTGSNPYAIHISFACKTSDWAKMTKERRAAFIERGAIATVEAIRWLEKAHGVTVPRRRLSRAQSTAGLAGFISHGERDPGRRSDPGADFPWVQLFAAINRRLAPPAAPPTIHADAAYEAALRGEKAASATNKPKWRAIRDALAKLSTRY